jgi:biopolymer transport protein ExbD
MADLVFLLLIFFLVTSTLISPNALKLLLPKSTNQISTKSGVSVSIKHHMDENLFTYHINGKDAVPWSSVEPLLQEALKSEDEQVVSLHADRSVPLEQIVNVMNIAKRNQYKVILATAPE